MITHETVAAPNPASMPAIPAADVSAMIIPLTLKRFVLYM